jgi:hypothetical protein
VSQIPIINAKVKKNMNPEGHLDSRLCIPLKYLRINIKVATITEKYAAAAITDLNSVKMGIPPLTK